MTRSPVDEVDTLTFDVFSTILDPSSSLISAATRFVQSKGLETDVEAFCAKWLARQRIEQLQESMMMTGHTGYVEASRRALVYTLRGEGIEFTDAELTEVLKLWWELSPFEDSVEALGRLKERYRLAILSNGDVDLLAHLVSERIGVRFDAVVSVQQAGAFKPHPAVYRTAARVLDSEPHRMMMVTAHSIDIMGARACGYRGAWVNRGRLPFDETAYRPDITTDDLAGLASSLLDGTTRAQVREVA
jgi:2-haloacid dehalogenase